MATFTTYIRATTALTRKEWIKQRRAAKSDSSTIIVNRGGVGGAVAAGSATVGGSSGAGDEALALLNELFERVNIGTEESPEYAIRAKYGLYSESFISAGGLNTTE